MDKFVVKDSGKREEFASGMVRDTADDKTDFSLPLSGPMFERWASHLTKGAKKYPDVKPGSPNWMLAEGEAELARFKKSAARHFIQWYNGQTDEDHAAAVFFNINGAEYVKDRRAKEVTHEADAKTRVRVSDDNRNQAIEKDFVSCGYERAKAGGNVDKR